MEAEERAFWESFLYRVQVVLDAEIAKGESQPYDFPEELEDDFHKATTVYAGDQYCQINQIREIFAIESAVPT
ncbi:MAG: hypothetical protein WAV50_01440 [Minisyncoccia bacterium]